MTNPNETLSGITPAENNEVLFIENTARAEAFLQKKFDMMIERMNRAAQKHNDEHPDEDPQPMQEPVEVSLITTRMSSKFYPFLLVLPTSVLKDHGGKRQKDELDIFNPQHTEKAANMKDPLFKIISPFMYDNRDKEAFFTQTLQHELKISSRMAGSLKGNCRLKIHSFDKGRTTYVAVFLDPIRLLHNMAQPLDKNAPPFVIHIKQVDQIKGGNFRYHFTRENRIGGKKNKKGFDIQRQIVQAVTGRRG